MNKTDLHSSLLFLMIKLEEAKSEQMADKNFVAALTYLDISVITES